MSPEEMQEERIKRKYEKLLDVCISAMQNIDESASNTFVIECIKAAALVCIFITLLTY